MKRAIFLSAILFLLLFSGCLSEQNPGDILYVKKTVDSNTATNKVLVDNNDSTAAFLLAKLAQGTNISFSILNPGGNEQIQINATGSSGSDSNKVAVSSSDTLANFLISKLVKGKGINVVQQNTGGNESLRIDFNAGPADLNSSQSCPGGQALQSIGNSTSCVDINSSSGSDTNKVAVSANDTTPDYLNNKIVSGTYTSKTLLNSGGNEQIRINAATCDNNSNCTIVGTVVGYVRDSVFNATFPLADANIISSSKWNADINWEQVNAIMPLGDVNILNASLYKATCDNNASCTLTGKITTVLPINAKDINFTGTLSGGDFNYSLSDANGSQACPGQALQSVGATITCVSIPTSQSRTYTSGTPATIQVDNDLNTISQNYDGNFWARFTTANDGNFYMRFKPNFDSNFNASFDSNFWSRFGPSFDSNFWSRFTPANDGNFWIKFTSAYDANFWSRFGPANDGNFFTRFTPVFDSNFWTRFSTAYDANFWSRFGPAYDSNFWSRFTPSFDGNFWSRFTPANDGNFYTRFKPNFDSNFYSRNAGDMNWVTFNTYVNPSGAGIPDANILNSSLYKATCDNNTSCTITGKITTGFTIDANKINFTGTISGGDFNMSISDVNDSQSCTSTQALQKVGNGFTCVAISGLDQNIVAMSTLDTTPGFLNVKIISGAYTSRSISNLLGGNQVMTISSSTCDRNTSCIIPSSDINWDSNSTLDSRYVKKSGDTMTGPLAITDANNSSAVFQVRDSDSNIALNVDLRAAPHVLQSMDHYPFTSDNYQLGSSVYHWLRGYISDLNVYNKINIGLDANVGRDLNVQRFTHLAFDVNTDKNVFVGGSLYGQVFGAQVTAGTSCNTECDAFDGKPGGSNWTCIAATGLAGVGMTCSDTLSAKNCMCKN